MNGEALEENQEMCTGDPGSRPEDGMPCLAECGGFMYLHQEMEDMEGKHAQSRRGDRLEGLIAHRKLNRFRLYHPYGKRTGIPGLGEIPAHEFHYFDSTDCGERFSCGKAGIQKEAWDCIHGTGTRLMAGFPASLLLRKSAGFRHAF